MTDLLAGLAVGDETDDPDLCDRLGFGIEGLFRFELPAQWAAWPLDSTTDGSIAVLCRRVDLDTLVVAGLTWIDFGGALFPFRTELQRTADGSVAVTGYVGQVDARTGAPPRLPGGTVMVPGPAGPELIVGRRQVLITWTRAFAVP
ncbi:MAG TPA: hypothetical protein VGO78_13270 [Acidimicrobiales bacterium]|nr:hypothetical protein [Acidimicrobiales bacterium]